MGHGLACLILSRCVLEQAPIDQGVIGVCRIGQVATAGGPMMESSLNMNTLKSAMR